MNDAIVEIFEGQQITIRPSDGYWNATEMCKRYGRKLNDFARLSSSKAYIQALSENTGIPALSLMELRKGRGQATWVHPRVALKVAAWLNPHFEVWVYSVIEKLLAQGKVELQESFDTLLNLLDISEDQVQELLDRAETLELDLARLGENYAIDDDARAIANDLKWELTVRDRRIEQLQDQIYELGGEPIEPS